jgi:hypothetical protein
MRKKATSNKRQGKCKQFTRLMSLVACLSYSQVGKVVFPKKINGSLQKGLKAMDKKEATALAISMLELEAEFLGGSDIEREILQKALIGLKSDDISDDVMKALDALWEQRRDRAVYLLELPVCSPRQREEDRLNSDSDFRDEKLLSKIIECLS